MNTKTVTIARGRKRLLAALAAVALLGAACGAGDDEAGPAVADLPAAGGDSAVDATDDGDSESDGPSTEMSPEEAELAFEQCMDEQGVDLGIGASEGEAIETDGDDGATQGAVALGSEEDFEKFESAMQACNSILDAAFGDFELSPEEEAAMKDAEAAFAQCMDEQGFPQSAGDDDVQVDEAGDDSGGAVFSFDFDEDQDPDAIEAAFEVCDQVFEDAGLGVNGPAEGGDS